MLIGEFESMKEIHKQMPEFVPKPIAWGSYASAPDTHFILMEYKEMILDIPDPEKFTARLSSLHQKSTSPNGMFGFHVTTYAGNLPQYTEWESSWEIFFAKSMRQALDLEIKAKGYDPEFDVLIPTLFDKVIPRLLRPLETEGRSIKPSLVHGDLWFGNAGIDSESSQPLVFDACCFFAHNECKRDFYLRTNVVANEIWWLDEFGQWRPVCNRFGEEYLLAYQKRVPISSPEEDFDGRVDLYKLCVEYSTSPCTARTNSNIGRDGRRFNTHVSALFHDNPTLREQ